MRPPPGLCILCLGPLPPRRWYHFFFSPPLYHNPKGAEGKVCLERFKAGLFGA